MNYTGGACYGEKSVADATVRKFDAPRVFFVSGQSEKQTGWAENSNVQYFTGFQKKKKKKEHYVMHTLYEDTRNEKVEMYFGFTRRSIEMRDFCSHLRRKR